MHMNLHSSLISSHPGIYPLCGTDDMPRNTHDASASQTETSLDISSSVGRLLRRVGVAGALR